MTIQVTPEDEACSEAIALVYCAEQPDYNSHYRVAALIAARVAEAVKEKLDEAAHKVHDALFNVTMCADGKPNPEPHAVCEAAAKVFAALQGKAEGGAR